MVTVERVRRHAPEGPASLAERAEAARRPLCDARVRLALLIVAAGMLIASIFLPYWDITLHAPQYPKGLLVRAYVSRLSGEVREVDELNHYIGMIKLDEAARLERALSRVAIPVVALLAVASFWARGRWKWLLILPAAVYPLVFVADLAAWLYYAGHALDPEAPLSTSIKPFTPHVLGVGKIGQFSTEARFAAGFYLALLSGILVVVATWMGRTRERAAR